MMRVPKRTHLLQFLTRRDVIFIMGRGQGPSVHPQEWVLDWTCSLASSDKWTQGEAALLGTYKCRAGFREGPVNLGFIHHHWESQDAETVARPGDIKCEGLSFQGIKR